MIIDSFRDAFKKGDERGWKKIYVMVDIHDTIFKSTYGEKERYEPTSFKTLDCLRMMTQDPRISLILWSSTYPQDLDLYLKELNSQGIYFDHVNGNSEEPSTKLSDFSKKPYFNVLLDDKAGFDPSEDWEKIYNYLYFERPETVKEKEEFLSQFRWEITTAVNGHKQAKLWKENVRIKSYFFGLWKRKIVENHWEGDWGTAPSKDGMRRILEIKWADESYHRNLKTENIRGNEL